MIELVGQGGEPILVHATGMAGAHDPVLQRQMPDRQRLQQWVGGWGHFQPSCFAVMAGHAAIANAANETK